MEQIDYADMIKLGFKVEIINDNIFFNKNGYGYKIVTKKLTQNIYIGWDIETKLCKLVRINKEQTIKAELPIENWNQLVDIVEFFEGSGKMEDENYIPEFT